MEATQKSITVSCHCGAARQNLAPRDDRSVFSSVAFCHCDTCRHVSGVLFTSYAPISSNPPPSVAGLQSHSTSPASTRYFCSTCGCHVFRATRPSQSAPPEEWEWEVATGVVIAAPDFEPDGNNPLKEWRHLHVDDTKDGGLSRWLPDAPPPPNEIPSPKSEDTLQASCHCKSISLQITRPSPDPSLNPYSPFSDLLFPFFSTPPAIVSNPSDTKWYLRPVPCEPAQAPEGESKPRLRYLTGTCACETCRLITGFEIQTWSFIPRRNIFISLSSPGSAAQPDYQPLDFARLPTIATANPAIAADTSTSTTDTIAATSAEPPQGHAHIPPAVKRYTSTPNRYRTFCPHCGATLFWHDNVRPDLIDVSAGLFLGGGARAEGWLAWWTGRVSFEEEAGRGRRGGAKAWGEGVTRELEGRLRAGDKP